MVRLRPSLLASITQRVAGRTVRARLIGATEYVDLPRLAARDGGRPWLAVSLDQAGAAIGINLKQLITESRILTPVTTFACSPAQASFARSGRAVIDGKQVYGFLGNFDAAHHAGAGLSRALVAQLRAKLLALGASSEVIATYVTGRGETVRVVTGLPTTSRGPITTVEDIGAINLPVRVTPPPATQTIAYAKARALGH